MNTDGLKKPNVILLMVVKANDEKKFFFWTMGFFTSQLKPLKNALLKWF